MVWVSSTHTQTWLRIIFKTFFFSSFFGMGANISYERNRVIRKTNDWWWVCLFWQWFEISKSKFKPKNNTFFFCLMLHNFIYVIVIGNKLLSNKCIKCHFYMENPTDWVDIVKSVENVSRKNWKTERAQHFLLFSQSKIFMF